MANKPTKAEYEGFKKAVANPMTPAPIKQKLQSIIDQYSSEYEGSSEAPKAEPKSRAGRKPSTTKKYKTLPKTKVVALITSTKQAVEDMKAQLKKMGYNPEEVDALNGNQAFAILEELKSKMVGKPKRTATPRATKKTATDIEKAKAEIKAKTGKTEAECEAIIEQYRSLRSKAQEGKRKAEQATATNKKRVAKLEDKGDLIEGTNVKTADAVIETTAQDVAEKIEQQIEAVEEKAEKEAVAEVAKDNTKKTPTQKKQAVEAKVEKKVKEKTRVIVKKVVIDTTALLTSIATSLGKFDKDSQKEFLIKLRSDIDKLLAKYAFGGMTDGAVQTMNVQQSNMSSSSVNPTMFANGGGVDNLMWKKGFIEPDEDSDDRRYAKYETQIGNLEIMIADWGYGTWKIWIGDKRDFQILKLETFEGDLEGAKYYAISLSKELKSNDFAKGGGVSSDQRRKGYVYGYKFENPYDTETFRNYLDRENIDYYSRNGVIATKKSISNNELSNIGIQQKFSEFAEGGGVGDSKNEKIMESYRENVFDLRNQSYPKMSVSQAIKQATEYMLFTYSKEELIEAIKNDRQIEMFGMENTWLNALNRAKKRKMAKGGGVEDEELHYWEVSLKMPNGEIVYESVIADSKEDAEYYGELTDSANEGAKILGVKSIGKEKYAKGGGVDGGAKIRIDSVDIDVYEDSYEEGEGRNVNSYSRKDLIGKLINPKELLNFLSNELYTTNDPSDYSIMDNAIFTSQLVDEDSGTATERQKAEWKKGNLTLYSENIRIGVSIIHPTETTDEELSELTGIGLYKKGGKVKMSRKFAKGGGVSSDQRRKGYVYGYKFDNPYDTETFRNYLDRENIDYYSRNGVVATKKAITNNELSDIGIKQKFSEFADGGGVDGGGEIQKRAYHHIIDKTILDKERKLEREIQQNRKRYLRQDDNYNYVEDEETRKELEKEYFKLDKELEKIDLQIIDAFINDDRISKFFKPYSFYRHSDRLLYKREPKSISKKITDIYKKYKVLIDEEYANRALKAKQQRGYGASTIGTFIFGINDSVKAELIGGTALELGEYLDKVKKENKEFFKANKKYESGGLVGQEIVFDDSGEENTGVIKEITNLGDYVVKADDGRTILAQRDLDVISLGAMRQQGVEQRKKRFGFFKDGGEIEEKGLMRVNNFTKVVNHFNSGDQWDLEEYPPYSGKGTIKEWMGEYPTDLEDAKAFIFESHPDWASQYEEEINDAKDNEELQDILYENDCPLFKMDNTYNSDWWGGVIQTGVLQADEDGYSGALVFVQFHRGGDVRGNYGEVQAFILNSFYEDFPLFSSNLTYTIETNRGDVILDTQDFEGYTLLVVEDATGNFEEGEDVTLDELSKTFDLRGYSLYAKGGITEHGLKLGDKIIGASGSEGEILNVYNRGKQRRVNIQTGERSNFGYAKGGKLWIDTKGKGGLKGVKPSRKNTFRNEAVKRNMTSGQLATKVLASPSRYKGINPRSAQLVKNMGVRKQGGSIGDILRNRRGE